jgi:hypothetical protein
MVECISFVAEQSLGAPLLHKDLSFHQALSHWSDIEQVAEQIRKAITTRY